MAILAGLAENLPAQAAPETACRYMHAEQAPRPADFPYGY